MGSGPRRILSSPQGVAYIVRRRQVFGIPAALDVSIVLGDLLQLRSGPVGLGRKIGLLWFLNRAPIQSSPCQLYPRTGRCSKTRMRAGKERSHVGGQYAFVTSYQREIAENRERPKGSTRNFSTTLTVGASATKGDLRIKPMTHGMRMNPMQGHLFKMT